MADERIAEQRVLATEVAEVDYPESDGLPMSENTLHGAAILSLRNALDLHYLGRTDLFLAGDLLLYYVQGNPRKVVGPDVIVALGVPAGHRSSYLVWKEGKVPDFVMEVSSPRSRTADRTEKRELYESLGIGEYFLYDPGYEERPSEMRAYRLWGGEYVEEQCAGEQELRSEVLGLGFRGEGERVRVRNLRTGKDLPTQAELLRGVVVSEQAQEAEAQARAAAEREREAEAQARATAEREREAEAQARAAAEREREVARARVAELEALLADASSRSTSHNPEREPGERPRDQRRD